MSSGERPIGAAKGKQPNTEALCQPPPTPGNANPASLASRSLFALGITGTLAAPAPTHNVEGQGKAWAPPRGSEAPSMGHGRASSEAT